MFGVNGAEIVFNPSATVRIILIFLISLYFIQPCNKNVRNHEVLQNFRSGTLVNRYGVSKLDVQL